MFKKGDRVSILGINKNIVGTVIGFSRGQEYWTAYVRVQRDGLKSPNVYHPTMLSLMVEDVPEPNP